MGSGRVSRFEGGRRNLCRRGLAWDTCIPHVDLPLWSHQHLTHGSQPWERAYARQGQPRLDFGPTGVYLHQA